MVLNRKDHSIDRAIRAVTWQRRFSFLFPYFFFPALPLPVQPQVYRQNGLR
jgi:hypothetical protein